MSGNSFTRTQPQVFGPVKRTKLNLMGIRFVENNDGGGGAGDTYVAPATQAEFDRIIGDRVARVEAKYAQFKGVDLTKLQAESAELATLKATQGNDIQQLTSKLAAAEQRATAAETTANDNATKVAKLEPQLLRYEVASDAKIPLSHAARLLGTTKEELAADAATYKTSLRSGGYDPGQGQGEGGASASDEGTAEAARRFGTSNT